MENPSPRPAPLARLFFDCVILGCTAWGGYMALLAQAQTQFVNRRGWVTQQAFIELIALVSVLPGPQAVNAIACLGYRLRGWAGFLAAAVGVILPGFLFILFLWKSYSYLDAFKEATRAVTIGVLPPLAAIIAKAAFVQAKGAGHGRKEILLAVVSALCILLLPFWGTSIAVLALGAAVSLLFWQADADAGHGAGGASSAKLSRILLCLTPVGFILFNIFPALLPDLLPAKIGLVFAGISTSLFGGGFLLIPLLQGLLVNSLGWLDQSTFTVALAASQLTPGPVLSVATFAGMQIGGFIGAVTATAGTYLPTAVITVGVSEISEKLMSSRRYQKAMAGIRCAVVGLIAGAAISLLQRLPVAQYPWQMLLLTVVGYLLVWHAKLPPFLSLPLSCLLAWFLIR